MDIISINRSGPNSAESESWLIYCKIAVTRDGIYVLISRKKWMMNHQGGRKATGILMMFSSTIQNLTLNLIFDLYLCSISTGQCYYQEGRSTCSLSVE